MWLKSSTLLHERRTSISFRAQSCAWNWAKVSQKVDSVLRKDESSVYRIILVFTKDSPVISLAEETTTQQVLKQSELEILFAISNNIQILSYQCSEFPSRFIHCEDAPVILFKKENRELNSSKVISIIGLRKESDHGRKSCQKIVEQLAPHQPITVSNLSKSCF